MKKYCLESKMVLQGKTLDVKPEDLRLVPGSHGMEEKN